MIKKILKKESIKPLAFLTLFLLISPQIFTGCNYSYNKEKETTTNTKKEVSLSDKKNMMDTINSICTSSRKIGSDGERKACQTLKKQIESYGYKTEVQKVSYDDLINNKNIIGESQNLIAVKKSTSENSKGVIVISAHYDCQEDSIGANDNGSGVAAVMEIARLLNKSENDYELRFIFFGGEELASTGSKYYLDHLSDKDKKDIKADINIDSIAQKNHDNPCIFTVDGKENFATNLLKDNCKNKNIVFREMLRERSDYIGFHERGIPSLCIGQVYDKNLNVNGPEDKTSILDEAKLKLVADIVIKSLRDKI